MPVPGAIAEPKKERKKKPPEYLFLFRAHSDSKTVSVWMLEVEGAARQCRLWGHRLLPDAAERLREHLQGLGCKIEEEAV